MKSFKATREGLKRHNRQLVLRAVYEEAADNRAALASITGLAKPTVSDIVSEMIEEGLLTETGLGESGDLGGKRPTLLRFVPDARQIIGISVEEHRILGVLSDMAGHVTVQHVIEHEQFSPEEIVGLIEAAINGLISQLTAPLLSIGIGMPGTLDAARSHVVHSPLEGLVGSAFRDQFVQLYGRPVHLANNSELAALAQFSFGVHDAESTESLACLLLNDSVEVGIAFNTGDFRYHQGGTIGSLRGGPAYDAQPLEALLGWRAVRAYAAGLRASASESLLPDAFTYMHLRYASRRADALACAVVDWHAGNLAQVLAWIVSLWQPDHFSLAGKVIDLGEDFLSAVTDRAAHYTDATLLSRTRFSLAYSKDLSALGAVALALQSELDIL
jgi:predicted NBD/HSP70 family sugar kinase